LLNRRSTFAPGDARAAASITIAVNAALNIRRLGIAALRASGLHVP
jgi:hypothetical protein